VAGVVAELSRFVWAGNLITAEVKLQNTSSLPTKFSCDDWQLIDEQTGVKSGSTADGGRVSSSFPQTLAPGETHVAWAKFKAEPGELSGNKYSGNKYSGNKYSGNKYSGNKYSGNIESILKRPFEGLAVGTNPAFIDEKRPLDRGPSFGLCRYSRLGGTRTKKNLSTKDSAVSAKV